MLQFVMKGSFATREYRWSSINLGSGQHLAADALKESIDEISEHSVPFDSNLIDSD